MIAQMLLALTLDTVALGVAALAGVLVLAMFLLALYIPVKLVKMVFGGNNG